MNGILSIFACSQNLPVSRRVVSGMDLGVVKPFVKSLSFRCWATARSGCDHLHGNEIRSPHERNVVARFDKGMRLFDLFSLTIPENADFSFQYFPGRKTPSFQKPRSIQPEIKTTGCIGPIVYGGRGRCLAQLFFLSLFSSDFLVSFFFPVSFDSSIFNAAKAAKGEFLMEALPLGPDPPGRPLV